MRIPAKHCIACGEYKPLTEFYAHTTTADRKEQQCKTCSGSRRRGDRERKGKSSTTMETVREWLWAEKSNPCERCGNTYHPVAMQFDHLPGFEKRFTVALKSAPKGVAALKAEREKCQLLCANCHHIVTWERKTGETVPVS